MDGKGKFDERGLDRRSALRRIGIVAAGAVAGPAVLARAAQAGPGAVSTASGGFVIGDLEAEVGNKVTFWGADWAKKNAMSGGAGPASFKGYAGGMPSSPPQCGQGWTAGPGNSSKPPASVDSLIYVAVASAVAQPGPGPIVSGDTTSVALVQTDPGYRNDPGHAGTGTVVAVGCYLTSSGSGSGSAYSGSGSSY